MKIGMLKMRLIQKRSRMSRTIACMSMPAPWPISCAMSSDSAGALPASIACLGGASAADFSAHSAAWGLVRILASLLLSARCGPAKVLGQNLAATIKSAVDDLSAQRFNVSDGLVVLDHCRAGSDVDCSGVHAGHALQLLLGPEKVENRQHATDFKNGVFHTSLFNGRSCRSMP